MSFSLIFLTHTALLLGQGQLTGYGVNSSSEIKHCRNELFRSARVVQEAAQDSQLVSNAQSDTLEKRITAACYKNRVSGAQEALEIPAL